MSTNLSQRFILCDDDGRRLVLMNSRYLRKFVQRPSNVVLDNVHVCTVFGPIVNFSASIFPVFKLCNVTVLIRLKNSELEDIAQQYRWRYMLRTVQSDHVSIC